MRRLLVVVLALCIAGAAMAASTSNKLNTEGKGLFPGDGAMGPRTGGEDIGTATVIGALPYADTGATCGFINNYDEVCPYSGSSSPDVVYAYTPAAAQAITVDLCDSSYDTKVYIYAGAVGNLVACNDDAGCGYSGWQSLLENIALTAGVTYYIVVDGYGSACGTYQMDVYGYEPCVVECPAGAALENEPPCQDNYTDMWNGGCNSSPYVFQPMEAQANGCGTMCGKSCTYLYYGSSYRDTDWFDCIGLGGTVTTDCTAEFPLQFIFIWNADCNNLQYDITTAGACQTATLSRYVGAGVHFWLWVGASVFAGIPESDYVLNACGIEGGIVPVQENTWGQIKNLYK